MAKIKHIFIPGIVDGELEVPDEVIASLVEAYLANHPETDPTVPSWAKQPSKPTYTASEVGAYIKPSGGIPKTDLASAVQTSLGKADTALQTAPVTSVNSKTGAVVLSASDVGALPSSTTIPSKTSDLTNDSGYQTAQEVQTAIAAAAELPPVTASENGKFLRVVNGAWSAETVQTWQGGSY